MRGVTFGAGVFIAIFAAGPIATLILAVMFLGSEPTGWRGLAIIPVFLLFSVPLGMMVAAIPAVICTAALAWLGGRVPLARHPLLWCGAGAAVGAGIGAALGDGIEVSAVLWLGVTGCLCALICRRGVRWPEGLSYTPPTR